MAWFVIECHLAPQQVYEMPWMALCRLTFVADQVAEQRQRAADEADRERRTTRI